MDAVKRVEAGIGVPDICREFKSARRRFTNGGLWRQGSVNDVAYERTLRREMAKKAVTERGESIRVACGAFRISKSCYSYESKLDAENDEVATWLIRLTDNHRNWGFGLCYLYLRNVKSFKWNQKRV